MPNRLGTLSKTLIAVAAGAVILALLGLFWWFQRDDAPDAVDLESTVARIEASENTDESAGATDDDSQDTSSASAASDDSEDVGTTSSTDDAPAASSNEAADDDDAMAAGTSDTASSDQTADAPAGLAGVWTVQVADDAGDLQGEPVVSFAGFRVNEVLGGGIGDFTAVGRTADVTGSIELTGTALVASTVEVTMSTLRTDNGSRDGQVRRALNTNEFPVATFTLTEPLDLPAAMADGESLTGSAHGDLTIKGITNRATFDLQAQLVGDTIVAVGSSEVVFSDYGVTAPTAPIVVSVEDHGIMEFQLILTR